LLSGTVARAGATLGLAAVLLVGASASLQNAIAEGDTRTLSFHHLHTGENITITYKRDGRYDEAALKKLDWFMRDWRKEQTTGMDPHLFDLLWEVYREVGATAPIDVVCGYRSPSTNTMLRQRSSGVAEFSQHTLGHAMDFYIPGVPLEKLREIGMRLQRGGVGFYPSSGSPFVHMDTGTIRHWPRMTYAQLSKVFPDGRTVHVASDGRPLPGYALALADVERRGKVPNALSLEQARARGAISAMQEQTAELVAREPQKRSLLARVFGRGKDTEEAADDNESAAAAPVERTKRGRMTLASADTKPVMTERIVPLPTARPQGAAVIAAAKAAPKPANAPYVMASVGANMFDARGLWQVAPTPLAALSKADTKPKPVEVASAEPAVTGSTGEQSLAYAPDARLAAADAAPTTPAVRVKAMGLGVTRAMAGEAQPARNTTLADKVGALSGTFASMTSGAQRLDSPWLRAAMLTPSVSHALTATRFGGVDPRGFEAFLHKPAQAVAMSFSADPTAGMRADRFTGRAVTFVEVATFLHPQTASLD
jgi:uncharacterized protein YcbK (DUF882 family)